MDNLLSNAHLHNVALSDEGAVIWFCGDENHLLPGEESCDRCWGSGEIVTCWDDMCAGTDRCIHGDGYGMCPDCKGSGFFIPSKQADNKPNMPV